jgi:hypothetical protein
MTLTNESALRESIDIDKQQKADLTPYHSRTQGWGCGPLPVLQTFRGKEPFSRHSGFQKERVIVPRWQRWSQGFLVPTRRRACLYHVETVTSDCGLG